MGPLRLELELPAEVPLGDSVSFKVRLRNLGEKPAVVYLRGREITFDVVVTRTNGDTVWHRLRGEPVQAIVQVRQLASHEELQLQDLWDQRDGRGRPVRPGDYLVQGMLFTDQPTPLMTPKEALRIRAAP
jgi:Intracellular proteinase inhibitor